MHALLKIISTGPAVAPTHRLNITFLCLHFSGLSCFLCSRADRSTRRLMAEAARFCARMCLGGLLIREYILHAKPQKCLESTGKRPFSAKSKTLNNLRTERGRRPVQKLYHQIE